jgi:hypothetical protein
MSTVAEQATTDTAANQGIDLPGVNVVLMGPAGTGKTHIIGTLVDAGVEVFYLALEPGLESLSGYYRDKNKEIPDNLHWHTLKGPKASFSEMIGNAEKINTLSLESLAKMADPNRGKHNQFISLLQALNDFPCDRTGQKYGPVNEWTPKRALVIDGLTGLGRAAMALVVGGKPVKSQSDWGIAQDQVEKLLRMLCDNCDCHFVLIAHTERETDAVLGGVKLMVSTLGAKLAPKIPSMFSDVILTVRSGTKFVWDTGNTQADLKTRNLPIKSDIEPGFGQIIKKWVQRGGKL